MPGALDRPVDFHRPVGETLLEQGSGPGGLDHARAGVGIGLPEFRSCAEGQSLQRGERAFEVLVGIPERTQCKHGGPEKGQGAQSGRRLDKRFRGDFYRVDYAEAVVLENQMHRARDEHRPHAITERDELDQADASEVAAQDRPGLCAAEN